MSLIGKMRRRLRPAVVARLLFYGLGVVAIAIDQLTKAWVVGALPDYQPVDLAGWLAPVFSLTSVRNTGIAFGLFPQHVRLFTVLPVIVVVAIAVFRRTVPESDLWAHAALGLVTGGALGNVIDRVLRGYVVDFIDVNFWPFRGWPVFNLADSAVVVGVFLLLVDSFLAQPEGEGIPADA